jgi:ubiquinone/menaquinone biosynthesis C-methylase UbiE
MDFKGGSVMKKQKSTLQHNPAEDNHTTVVSHYESADEQDRLRFGIGQLEFARTCDIIQRFGPSPPAVVLDIGGGAGIYALWLASLEYEVHLIDPVPKHCQQAEVASAQSSHPLFCIKLGDARNLQVPDASADIVLLLGPLYHLIDKKDRIQSLREAARVLRHGGLVFAAAISRFASAIDGLFSGYITDPDFREIVYQDLRTGQHRNPVGHPDYFTTAYFHHPMELQDEMMQAGLVHECTLAVEGVGCMLSDFSSRWEMADYRQKLLGVLRKLEEEPTLLGASSHILAIGRR